QGRADTRAYTDIQKRRIAACCPEARFGQCRSPHIGGDDHIAVRSKRLADSSRSPRQYCAALDLASRADQLGHTNAHLVDRQPELAASVHDLSCDGRCARQRVTSATRRIRSDRAKLPYRSGSWNKESGPDARAADIDAEHAPLAIAGPRGTTRPAGHGKYLGAT